MSLDVPGRAWRDPMKLCPCIRVRYARLLDEVALVGIRLTLIETLRDEERQRHYLAIGVSQTIKSLHLPQPPNGLALAFDVAPTAYLHVKGWNPVGDDWQTVGQISEGLGLEWGGRWPKLRDRPHHQLRECLCEHDERPEVAA